LLYIAVSVSADDFSVSAPQDGFAPIPMLPPHYVHVTNSRAEGLPAGQPAECDRIRGHDCGVLCFYPYNPTPTPHLDWFNSDPGLIFTPVVATPIPSATPVLRDGLSCMPYQFRR
jgi:hypothetical protein